MSQNSSFPYVSHKELETTVHEALASEKFWAWLLIAVTIAMAAYWVRYFGPVMPYWGAGIFLFVIWLQGSNVDIPKGILVEKAPPEKLGKYTAEQLHAIVREISESFWEKEVPNVYLVDETSEAMAAVVNVDILNFIKPWNAIYIGPYLLHTLEEDELKAVLSHEMCHFSLHYNFWTRYFYLKIVIFAVWVTVAISYLYHWTSGWFVGQNWLVKLVLAYVVLKLGQFMLNASLGIIAVWTSRADSQEVEALCDFEAARRYGLLSVVNVLLKTGTRQEIFTALLAQFSPDAERPVEGLVEATAHEVEGTNTEERQQMVSNQAIAMQAAYLKLNEILPYEFLTLEEATPYIDEAVRTGMNEAEAERYQHASKQMLRWLEHDTNIANRQLDRVEYETFIEELKNNPDKPLFYISEEMDEDLAAEAEHPTFRNRILFLEYNKEEFA